MAKQQKIEVQDEIFLSARTDPLTIKGKLSYSEWTQSWSIIRLKRDIIQEFPQLKQKRDTFGYTLVIPKSQEEMKEALSEAKDKTIPILLFFNKEAKESS